MTGDELAGLIRETATALGSRRPTGDVIALLGTADGEVVVHAGVSVAANHPLLREAIVMPGAAGAAEYVKLLLAEAVELDALSPLGAHGEPFAVNPETPRRVEFDDLVEGCTIWADLDDAGRVRAVLVRVG